LYGKITGGVIRYALALAYYTLEEREKACDVRYGTAVNVAEDLVKKVSANQNDQASASQATNLTPPLYNV